MISHVKDHKANEKVKEENGVDCNSSFFFHNIESDKDLSSYIKQKVQKTPQMAPTNITQTFIITCL